MKRKTIFIALFVLAADQIVKALIRQIPVGAMAWRLDGVLEITHSINTGAAFSMFAGNTAFVTVLSLVLLLSVMFYMLREMKLTKWGNAALACLIGGGVGNLADRLLYSGVTDYIRLLFIEFPIFNLADIAITVSIAVLMLLLLTGRLEENTGDEHGRDC